MPSDMHVVILGNGIGGITAARFVRKLSNCRITVISRETDYFFSRTALMYVYMGHMRFVDTQPYEPWFWKKNQINLVRGDVEKIDFDSKILHLTPVVDSSSKLDPAPAKIEYDKLVLALGSQSNKFGWPGQDLQRVQGLYSYQDLQSMIRHTAQLERAVIVGGGLIGIEMAEMLHSRHIPVTFLVRETDFWDIVLPSQESQMISRHIREHGIDLRLSTELAEIEGNDDDQAIAVITNHGERIECQFVGLTAGVHPNVQWLRDTQLEIDKGILVDKYLQTNIDNVYAIGDCAQVRSPKPGRRPVEAVWYVGRIMGETVAYSICDQPTAYDPGIWFNSAKFFDIEYQVYGTVPSKLPEDLTSVFWESSQDKRSIRIVYKRTDKSVIGFNLLGVRFRHEVCEKWIREGAHIEEVLSRLDLARFDPELSSYNSQDIVSVYNKAEQTNIEAHKKLGLYSIVSFLNNS